jgi:biotin carboxyl carrier protein
MSKHAFVRRTGDRKNPAEDVDVVADGDHRWSVTVRGRTLSFDAIPTQTGVLVARDGVHRRYHAEQRQGRWILHGPTGRSEHEIVDRRTWLMRSVLGHGAGAVKPELVSPMAGKVILVRVAPGDEVAEGQALVIIEAMKMENELRALGPARVKDVRVAAGDVVNPGDVLLTFVLDED